MASLTAEQKRFIAETPIYAVVTTLRADGSPHSTVIWVDIEGDDIVFNTAVGRAKEVHLKADPRIAVALVDPQDPYKWVAVSGTATFGAEGDIAMINRLSNKYIGKDYPWLRPDEVRISVTVHAEKIDSLGLDAA
jgi:PPOX class probable F420-dependent enzyme